MTWSGSVIPALVGTVVVSKQGPIRIGVVVVFLLAAVSVQSITNLWNDYFDFLNGQDQENWLVGFLYSAGPRPLSALGLGEVTAAVSMGRVVTVLAYGVQRPVHGGLVWFASVPMALLIGSMILTNNIRDIEKDLPSRRTVPIRSFTFCRMQGCWCCWLCRKQSGCAFHFALALQFRHSSLR